MPHKNPSSLILLTNHFPFGMAEAFLENEIDYLIPAFDKVVILTKDVSSVTIRRKHSGYSYHRMNAKSNFKEKCEAFSLYFIHLPQIVSFVRSEYVHVKAIQGKFSLPMAARMMHDLTKSLIISSHLKKIINKYKLTGTLTLYSYWLNSSALATTFIKPDGVIIKRVARAHGGDVYETRQKLPYLSFRRTLAVNLDRIFSISEDAKAHLLNVSRQGEKKIRVSRLGTHKQDVVETKKRDHNRFVIVSCSFLLPVKRIHLIIESLSLIEDLPLYWIHIGDGPLRDQLIKESQKKLSGKSNIHYEFKGNLTNAELLQFYGENFVDLFINTSSSEGVPVTMMEAQSFGIPIVAPQTGGIPEIVSNENGRLFSPDSAPEVIADIIKAIGALSDDDYSFLRSNAFKNWSTRYNAEKNFPTFVAELLNV